MENRDAVFAAFDEARAAGKNNAEALFAASLVDGRDVVTVFNDMLATPGLDFVFVDVRHLDPKNGEGLRLVRVDNPEGRHVVDSRLVD